MPVDPNSWWSRMDRPECVLMEMHKRRSYVPDNDMADFSLPQCIGWGPPAGFFEYFFEPDEAHAFPEGIVADTMNEMYEAMREAGFAVLVDFARKLVPVIQAIEAFNDQS